MTNPAAGSVGMREVLRNRLFRLLWVANLVSGIGTTAHETAAVWSLAAMGAAAGVVALMQTMTSLPVFLFCLPAGALADSFDKRRFILGFQLYLSAAALAVAGMSWAGWLTPGWLLAFAFLLGLGNAFSLPAWQAYLPEITRREEMQGAITLGSIGVNLARSVGPALGGLLLARFGPGVVFAFNAISTLAVVAALVVAGRATPPRPRTTSAERFFSGLVAALRHVRHHAAIRATLWRHGLFAFLAVAPVALLPVVVREAGWAASSFGLLMGAYGAGGVVTALVLVPRLRARWGPGGLLNLALAATAAATLTLGWRPGLAATAGAMFAAGGGWLLAMSQLNIAGQTSFAHWVRARASAMQLVVVQGSLALGAFLWGRAAEVAGLRWVLFALAAAAAVVLVVTLMFPLDRWLQDDFSPGDPLPPHEGLSLQPEHTDGPILVTVTYQVAAEDAGAFRAAAEQLREVRLRDGAFRWDLWQDLANPSSFTEAFLVSSWEEHERQHRRATVAGHRAEAAVLQFHRGTTPPAVRHHRAR